MNNIRYTVLITGANRGLGLEFTKQYAADGWQVIACCREPKSAAALNTLKNTYPKNIVVYALDVANFGQIDKLAELLTGKKIDILLNNAGIYPESASLDMNYEDWMQAFKVNTMGPYKIVETFIKNVAASELKKIVLISSKMGSLSDNHIGGSNIYRTSKAAANMMMKSLSLDLKEQGIACGILHPGWVQTDMGGPNGLINTQQSISGLRQVIAELNLNNCGRFIAYDGKEIAW